MMNVMAEIFTRVAEPATSGNDIILGIIIVVFVILPISLIAGHIGRDWRKGWGRYD